MIAPIKWPIKAKLILVITLVNTLTVGIALFFLVVSQYVVFKKGINEHAFTDVKIISDCFTEPLSFQAKQRGYDLSNEILEKNHAVCLAVYDSTGGVFVENCKEGYSLLDMDMLEGDSLVFFGDYILVNNAITHNAEYLGGIKMMYYTGLRSRLLKGVAFSILAFVVSISASVGLALYFQQFISRPILNLAN